MTLTLAVVPADEFLAEPDRIREWFGQAAAASAPSPAAADALIDNWTYTAMAGICCVIEFRGEGGALAGRLLAETFGDGLNVMAAQRAALGPRLAVEAQRVLHAWAVREGFRWVLVEVHTALLALALEAATDGGKKLFERREGAAFLRRL